MGQEFFINSQDLEDKIRTLLPSQGGSGSGFDLSASTQIIPIIDLTESAEGSNLRQDLQSAISFDNATVFNVTNTTSTVINNTGYWRIFGSTTVQRNASGSESVKIAINDGAATKIVWENTLVPNSGTDVSSLNLDFIVFLSAGDSLEMTSTNVECFLQGSVRQIASIDGTLTNPT